MNLLLLISRNSFWYQSWYEKYIDLSRNSFINLDIKSIDKPRKNLFQKIPRFLNSETAP